MANIKKAFMPYYSTGTSGLYARIQKIDDGTVLDNADGVFRATPASPNVPLSENTPKTPSVYFFNESRTVWADGQYHVFAYDSLNVLFAGSDMFIIRDNEVSLSELLEYMELIKKIEEGNWELKEDTKEWIYYDSDGSTELMKFSVFDKDGIASVFNIFKRVRV